MVAAMRRKRLNLHEQTKRSLSLRPQRRPQPDGGGAVALARRGLILIAACKWCIMSEGLNFAVHGLGLIIGQGRLTFHHNLIAHNQGRNPRFGSLVEAEFRNNVIYDWGDTAGCGEFDWVNYVGNFLKAGPSTRKASTIRLF
jgi:hypothetical protein